MGSFATEKDAKSALASHLKIPVRDLPHRGQTSVVVPLKTKHVYVNGRGYEVRAPDGSYIGRYKTQADAHGVSGDKKKVRSRVERRVVTRVRFAVMKRIFKEVLCRSCALSC